MMRFLGNPCKSIRTRGIQRRCASHDSTTWKTWSNSITSDYCVGAIFFHIWSLFLVCIEGLSLPVKWRNVAVYCKQRFSHYNVRPSLLLQFVNGNIHLDSVYGWPATGGQNILKSCKFVLLRRIEKETCKQSESYLKLNKQVTLARDSSSTPRSTRKRFSRPWRPARTSNSCF